jgi:PAS domain S-box-containing protein
MAIDFRTVFFIDVITNVVCFVVMLGLWWQSRKRFNGIGFLVFDFCLQVLGLLLISLRGYIPDFLSIIVSNSLSVTGSVLGLIGLEYFFDKKSRQLHNFILIGIFFSVQSYFTLIEPNLAIRNLNFSVIFLIITFQYAWLIMKRLDVNLRAMSIHVGIVFILYSCINLLRITGFFLFRSTTNDYFGSGNFEVFVIVIYQVLFIYLTFALAMMFNNRLMMMIASQEEKFSKAFYSVPYAIILTRVYDGKIFEVNNGFLKISGFSLQEVIEKTTIEIGLWNSEDDRNSILIELERTGKVIEKEIVFKNKSGNVLTCMFFADTIIINNIHSILSVIVDITERKEMENKLIELNATKDKFFSIIAHDLRSPFNSIVGYSEILVEQIRQKEMDQIEQYAEIILQSSHRAMDLLMNLMEWSRAKTGRMEFTPKIFDLIILINENVILLNNIASKKSIRIVVNLPISARVFADPSMISTIIRNLISNAIKFTEEGGEILISTKMRRNKLLVSVSDTGIGIDEDRLRKLFCIDENSSTLGTQNEKGTGLGLILCNEFMEKHSGSIEVESEPGKGSVFSFELISVDI